MNDVWCLESHTEQIAIVELNFIFSVAISGDEEAQSYLRKLWNDESWESIQEKFETEGSVWYVWFMDGVNNYIKNKMEGKPWY